MHGRAQAGLVVCLWTDGHPQVACLWTDSPYAWFAGKNKVRRRSKAVFESGVRTGSVPVDRQPSIGNVPVDRQPSIGNVPVDRRPSTRSVPVDGQPMVC